VLRIVTEFDDIPVAVVGFEQVSLCAAPHFSHVPDGGGRHCQENAVI
jgi:hypothetical protein